MSTGSILSILAYPQYGYHLIYHTGLSLVHCSYLSVGSLQSVGEGQGGAGGTQRFLMRGDSVSQSVLDQLGRLGVGINVGGARLIVIGTWLEPVEGREISQDLNIGRWRGFAKARSITEGWALPTKGNLVYSPGWLRRAKPASAAFSK